MVVGLHDRYRGGSCQKVYTTSHQRQAVIRITTSVRHLFQVKELIASTRSDQPCKVQQIPGLSPSTERCENSHSYHELRHTTAGHRGDCSHEHELKWIVLWCFLNYPPTGFRIKVGSAFFSSSRSFILEKMSRSRSFRSCGSPQCSRT